VKANILFLAVSAACAEMACAQSLPVNTLPAGGVVRAGTAQIGTPGVTGGGVHQLTVTQTSQRAVLDWTSLNVGSNAALVHDQALGAASITAHRVPGALAPSVIEGLVSAPGNVMILNSRGVMFGATASVNVAGLIASTGDLNPAGGFAEFMAGGPFAISGATAGAITNHGSITVSDAGLAAFVAPSVTNAGSIVAASGRIVLASAQTATVSFNGGLYELAVNQGVADGAIANSGTLSAPGGSIVLSALDAANVVSGVINLEGVQQANRIEVHGGHVILSSDLDAATVTGSSRVIDVCECGQIQDAVDIALSGTPGGGASVHVAGTHGAPVVIDKAHLTLTGHDATLNVAAGQSGFTLAADGVTVQDMNVVGPYGTHYSAVNWSAQPDITSGFALQPGVSGATIRDNEIRDLRSGVLMLGAAPGATITGNLIDNTKGSILVRSDGATLSGNRRGASGSEWDIVFLNGVTNGAYFTSPHANQRQYGADMMAMSADNGGMRILDRRYGSNGLLGSTPQFGNRSHVMVSAGSSFTAADDFNLGNGLGNERQPLGSIGDALKAVVDGGFVEVGAGTYTQSATLNVNRSVTLTGAGQGETIIDARGVSGYGMLVTADHVSLSHFTLRGPQANVGTSYGIKVQPAGSGAAARLHDFAIAHVTSRGAGRAELDLNGVVGATLDHFTAQGDNSAGAGIQITDSANVTISNSTTGGNNWGGVALFQANRFFDQQVDSISVLASNQFSEANPLYLQDESASRNFGALSLQGFGYTVRNASNGQFTWLQYELGDALAFASGNAAPLSSTVQRWNGSAATQDFYVGSGMSIMQAVDQASGVATVNVLPGNYTEIASGRTLGPGVGGTYDLGLFLYKDGMTLRGVDALGNPINSASGVQAWITAGASTNFGMNHGVVADHVTVQGLGFKPHAASANKTIEIAGDNFSFVNSVVDNRSAAGGAGALYFGELLSGAQGQIRALNVSGSIFYDGSVSLQNGVGVAADGVTFEAAASRTITGNTFVGSSNYRFGGLLLTGKMDEVPWRPLPIGAALATGNSFSGFDESVLVRGEQQGVDLKQIMATNSFDRAVLVTDAGGNARAGQYLSLNGVTRGKFSIQSSIQAGIDRAQAGDTVSVGAGLYAEQLSVTKDLTLAGAGAGLTTVRPDALADAGGMRSILTIGGGAQAEVSGFTFRGPVPEINAGIFVRDGAHAHLHDNAIVDIRESAALSGNQRGIGIHVGRAALGTSGSALIENNVITGYQKGGIVVDAAGSQATISGNTVTGEGPTGVIAQNGIQASRGASAQIFGNTISGNHYTGADQAAGILIFTPGSSLGQGSIVVGPNTVSGNQVGVWTNDPGTLATISLDGVSGNVRNGVADFDGGFAGAGALLEYPAWSASDSVLVNAGAFSGAQSGDLLALDGALRVSGWDGFAAIQPAIDAAAAGGMVTISSGTYAENVVVGEARRLAFDDVTLQSLTVNAAGTGMGGNATANGAGGFVFNAPVVLHADTSLRTTGADIVFNADIQNAGATPFDLSLSSGTGDVLLTSGGSASNPLGRLRMSGDDFTLLGTLWVSGYDLDAAGDVALSDHTLRSPGGSAGSIVAGGDVTGSVVSGGKVQIQGGGDVILKVVTSGQVVIKAGESAQITGSAQDLVISAPAGSVDGSFGDIVNVGGVLDVNGQPAIPLVVSAAFDPSRVLPADPTLAEGSAPLVTGDAADAEAERREARIVRRTPRDAGAGLDSGLSVELDLRPGNPR
jgi:filamentous hemagglutinin family protein